MLDLIIKNGKCYIEGQLKDVDEWEIPDSIQERINKELPQFQANGAGTVNQDVLDAFLINSFRQIILVIPNSGI